MLVGRRRRRRRHGGRVQPREGWRGRWRRRLGRRRLRPESQRQGQGHGRRMERRSESPRRQGRGRQRRRRRWRLLRFLRLQADNTGRGQVRVARRAQGIQSAPEGRAIAADVETCAPDAVLGDDIEEATEACREKATSKRSGRWLGRFLARPMGGMGGYLQGGGSGR